MSGRQKTKMTVTEQRSPDLFQAHSNGAGENRQRRKKGQEGVPVCPEGDQKSWAFQSGLHLDSYSHD